MASVIAPDGPLCAGQLYEFTVDDPSNIATIQWGVLDNSLPNGVTADEIFYSAPQNVTTLISVPVEGNYSFVVKTCVLA